MDGGEEIVRTNLMWRVGPMNSPSRGSTRLITLKGGYRDVGERKLAEGPSQKAPRARRRYRYGWRESLTGLLFVLPAVAIFAAYGAYTIGYGFLLSFAQWNGVSPHWDWVGLQNYKDLFFNGNQLVTSNTRSTIGITATVLVVLPIAIILISFPIAVMLNGIPRLKAFLRTIYMLPFITTGIAVFYAWQFMYRPDGAVNATFRILGLHSLEQSQGFLGNPRTSLPAVVVVMIWGGVPIGILLYLTGLQSLPQELLDAARIDGAGRLKVLTSVVLPLLNPVTALLAVLVIRGALQDFQTVLLLTNGGPVRSTTTLGLEAYNYAFGNETQGENYGYASALGWALFVVAIVLAAVNLRVLRSRV